ncbi:SGNH/GDSL hydrolase family protein [Streptomyces sp. SID9124]|uniref:SGNH/GDSL hydrolase family protein n=1 Tax=Streptomyces sp. SID9124 TaxID=2706108 RepID=UPI0013E082DE|nr:SGNH/GDSL hydrolase family protein [Streptomyces sp. SID9124]NED13878.1 SGNH/GDSL hydrolase family protein [Streptomyces sp. SID9124]
MMHRTRPGGAVSKRRTTIALAALSSCALAVGFTGTASAAAGGVHGTPRSTYVALGDSYTSGPLIPTQVDANCARSDHNYPSITARQRHVASFTDVSCGGATTAEMWQAQGTNGPQLDAVKRDTDLVTLQIGGNDVGFGSIIGTCAGLSAKDLAGNPCQQYYGAAGYDQLTVKILQTAPKVARVLREVHKKAPHARVVVVGYPDLLPDDGTGCYPDVPFAAKDFPYLRDTEKRLNLMLRAVALLNRADYVDTYGPTVGHDMCTAPADRWIEPLRPASPAAPAHPNAKGEEVMAQALVKTLNRDAWRH